MGIWTWRAQIQHNSEPVRNTKCQGRGGGFWRIEPRTTLIQQHHYSIYSSCGENIYSGEVFSQGLTAEETALGRKVFLRGFFPFKPFSFVGSPFQPTENLINVSNNCLNILKKILPWLFHWKMKQFLVIVAVNLMSTENINLNWADQNFSHLIVWSHSSEKCLCCCLAKGTSWLCKSFDIN